MTEVADARLSLYHNEHPFSMNVNGEDFGVGYWPGDSKSGMFGGNSNWRGPIWLAVNFLLIERYVGAGVNGTADPELTPVCKDSTSTTVTRFRSSVPPDRAT